MCIWSKPYIVSKACGCGSRRYVYEQATRRVGGKTQTRNRHLGILGQVRLRPSPVSFDAIVTTTMVEAVRRIKGQTTVSMTRRPEDIAGMAEQATGNGEPKYLADVTSGLHDLWRVNKELFSKAWMLGALAEFLKKMGVPSEHVDEEALAVFYGKVKGANERADDAVDTRLEEPDPFERAMSERAVRAIEEFGQQHPDYNSPWAKYWRAHWHNSESIAVHPDEPSYRIFDIDEGGDFGEGKTFTADEALDQMTTVYAYDWDEDAMGKPMSEATLEDFFGASGQETFTLAPVPDGSPIGDAKPTGPPLPPRSKSTEASPDKRNEKPPIITPGEY